MTEPYTRSGRGGAGNFRSREEVKRQNPSTLDSTITSTSTPSEYQHTGRGGAGNYIQPTFPIPPRISSTTTSPTTSTFPTHDTPHKPEKAGVNEKAVYKGGRGGVGNYSWGEGGAEKERERREKEKEREREREEGVRKMVEEEVEEGLRRPGRVVVRVRNDGDGDGA